MLRALLDRHPSAYLCAVCLAEKCDFVVLFYRITKKKKKIPGRNNFLGFFDGVRNAEQTRVKGAHHISTSSIRQYFALRTFMYGKHRSTIKETFQLLREEFGEKSMGHGKFERLQRAWLCPEAAQIINNASQAAFHTSEVITIDEKLKPYYGESPFLRYVPNKDPPKGHWITETTMKGAATGLPFLLNCYPVQQESGPTCLELFQACLSWIPEGKRKDIVVVSDAYYMDDASRTWLRAAGFMYLAAINPTRFKEV